MSNLGQIWMSSNVEWTPNLRPRPQQMLSLVLKTSIKEIADQRETQFLKGNKFC